MDTSNIIVLPGILPARRESRNFWLSNFMSLLILRGRRPPIEVLGMRKEIIGEVCTPIRFPQLSHDHHADIKLVLPQLEGKTFGRGHLF